MRVIYAITRGDVVGGAQLHVRDLAIGTRDAGHDLLVVCGNEGELTRELQAEGIAVEICKGMLRAIHPVRDVAAVRDMTRIIDEYKPEIVSAHSSKAGTICRIAARRAGVPAVFTAHGFAFTDGVPQPTRTIYKVVERITERLADNIICVSEFDRQIGIKAGMSPKRLVTIHNGMTDVDPHLRAKPADGDPVRLVMTARFDRQKDHDTLLRAIATVPDVHLDLIGTGPDMEKTQQLAQQLGVDDRVHFLGQRFDVAEILAGAHVFVLSSNWEGFPRSTLEGMRAGLPVVVSDVGGSAEAIVVGKTGFTVRPNDREELASRIRELAVQSRPPPTNGRGRPSYGTSRNSCSRRCSTRPSDSSNKSSTERTNQPISTDLR